MAAVAAGTDRTDRAWWDEAQAKPALAFSTDFDFASCKMLLISKGFAVGNYFFPNLLCCSKAAPNSFQWL